MKSYVRRQLERVLAAGTDSTGKFRVKVTGNREESKWLSVTRGQLAAIIEVLGGEEGE